MALGTISSIIDTLEFDTTTGQFPDIINISGNIFAIAYGGPASDGWVCTVNIDPFGNIGAAVIDTLEFDTTECINPKIINISGDIYAIAYEGETNIEIATVDIDSTGAIENAVVDTWSSTDSGSSIEMGSILAVSGDIYAVAYNATDYHGQVITVDIDSAGTITAGEVDTLEFDATQGMAPCLINISGTMYAIAYSGPGNDGWLCTLVIENDGTIAAAVTATKEFDTDFCSIPKIINVAGDIYAIVYKGTDGDGWACTIDIDSAGAISAVLDTLEFDTSDGVTPDIVSVSGMVYAVAYEGVDGDGFLKTFMIDTSGTFSAVLATLEFDTGDCAFPSLILISSANGIIAFAYEGTGSDGWLKSAQVTTEPGEAGGVIAIVETRIHYVDAYGTERFIQGTAI